ncbi:MAG TPA: hypothetical protein VLI72_18245 [Methylibium sp.]|nr:hypothetical protein [Methylibium sp.]
MQTMTSTGRTVPGRARGSVVRRLRREARLLLTAAGAALAFDAGVFLLLALLAASVPLYWRWPLPGEAWLALAAAVSFALFWAGLSQPDWRRYRKLHRRWIDQPDLPPVPWRVSTLTQRTPLPPPPVRSAYRPARGAASTHSRWVWRASR